MREPAVLLSPMPVFYPGRNLHNITRLHSLCRFTFFLIPAFSVYADKNLSTAFGCMMNMPVIPASRFKGDIADCECLSRSGQYIQIGLTDKILRIGIVRLSPSEKSAGILLPISTLMVTLLLSFRDNFPSLAHTSPKSTSSFSRPNSGEKIPGCSFCSFPATIPRYHYKIKKHRWTLYASVLSLYVAFYTLENASIDRSSMLFRHNYKSVALPRFLRSSALHALQQPYLIFGTFVSANPGPQADYSPHTF